MVSPEELNYMDVSPKQLVSVAAAVAAAPGPAGVESGRLCHEDGGHAGACPPPEGVDVAYPPACRPGRAASTRWSLPRSSTTWTCRRSSSSRWPRLWQRLLGRPASSLGGYVTRTGATRGRARRRRALMLPILPRVGPEGRRVQDGLSRGAQLHGRVAEAARLGGRGCGSGSWAGRRRVWEVMSRGRGPRGGVPAAGGR